jgi:hypothetical protein
MSATNKGPQPTYTYRPKMGDVVVFPNGIEINYSEHDETLIVVGVPEGHTLWVDSLDRIRGIFGVRVK